MGPDKPLNWMRKDAEKLRRFFPSLLDPRSAEAAAVGPELLERFREIDEEQCLQPSDDWPHGEKVRERFEPPDRRMHEFPSALQTSEVHQGYLHRLIDLDARRSLGRFEQSASEFPFAIRDGAAPLLRKVALNEWQKYRSASGGSGEECQRLGGNKLSQRSRYFRESRRPPSSHPFRNRYPAHELRAVPEDLARHREATI